MLEEDGGWLPPRWARDDFALWRVGWAQEKKTGMAEALVEGKRRAKSKPQEDRDPPGAELQLSRFESERD